MGVSEDLDGSYTNIAMGDETRGDEQLFVEFHKLGEYDKVATEGEWIENPAHPDAKPIFKKGSITRPFFNPGETIPRSHIKGEIPVFHDKVYIRMASPGDKFSVVDKEATDIYKARFPKQYSAFLKGENQDAAMGTPLDILVQVKLLAPSEAETLKYFYVRTIEQLIGVPPEKAPVQGLPELQRKAKAFLEVTQKPIPAAEQRKMNEDVQRQLAELRQENETLRKAKQKAA